MAYQKIEPNNDKRKNNGGHGRGNIQYRAGNRCSRCGYGYDAEIPQHCGTDICEACWEEEHPAKRTSAVELAGWRKLGAGSFHFPAWGKHAGRE